MARCIICDASDLGLSDYRPDGKFHAHRFKEIDGGMYCEECSNDIDETLNEMYDNDLDNDESAFDYDS